MFGISPPLSIDDLFVNWSKVGGTIYNSLLLTAASALCWTIWITRNEVVFDKCRPIFFCRYSSEEPIGCGNGQDCSGVMIYGTSWHLLAGFWRHQPCISLVPMGGSQIDLSVFLSQDFTSRFVFSKSGCKPVNCVSCVLTVGSNLVIIGMILPHGR